MELAYQNIYTCFLYSRIFFCQKTYAYIRSSKLAHLIDTDSLGVFLSFLFCFLKDYPERSQIPLWSLQLNGVIIISGKVFVRLLKNLIHANRILFFQNVWQI